jgi:hypothetical protein
MLNQENTMNDVIATFEKICMEFINTFQDKLIWEWDDRFEAALATCKTNDKDDIQLSIKQHLEAVWDNSNTDDAPDAVLDIISRFGGLMPGQLLFMSGLNQDILLCCAWWPWGDGETVSIRVSIWSEKLSDDDNALLTEKFKIWFRLQD